MKEAPRHLASILVPVVLFASLLAGGCGPDFDPYWRVNTFRVLAIKAEPPTLGEGEQTTLSVLDHNPDGVEVDYRWQWCPMRASAQDRYECPLGVDEVNEMLREQAPEGQSVPELPPDFFELGEGPTARFDYPTSEAQVRAFCDAIVEAVLEAGEDSPLGERLPVLDCSRGFEISVRLVATSDDEEIVARKRLLLKTGPETPRNDNPRLTDIDIKLANPNDVDKVIDQLPWVAHLAEHDSLDWYSLPQGQATPAVAGIPLRIRAVVAPASVETWKPPAPKGSGDEHLPAESEVIAFRWFVSQGTVADTRGLFVEDQNTLAAAGATDFNVARDGASGEVYLWAVVRDGRLGVDFIERRLRLEALQQ
jgi:hypothetical protein